MKNTNISHSSAFSLSILLFATLLWAQDSQLVQRPKHHRYRLIDVGTFGGPQGQINPPGNGQPYINKRGVVVGFAQTTVPLPPDMNGFLCFPGQFVNHAFKWKDGELTDLGALRQPEDNCSDALGVSDRGEIVGQSSNGVLDPLLGLVELRGVLWKNGKIINLGTFGGNESHASSINNQGQVAGFALNDIPDPYSIFGAFFMASSNSTQTRAFLWQNGKKRDLGTLGGPDATPFPGAINERGQIAGMSYTNSTPGPPSGLPPLNPFLWNKGRMIDLGSLGGNFGLAIALNEHGQVVGFSDLYGDASSHPYIWDHRGMRDLGTLGGNLGEADSINDTGEVAGGASLPGDDTEHAFLWKKNKLKDLGVVPGDRCSHAWSINSSGQVVGSSGMCLGALHAFLWENGEIVAIDDLVFPKSDVRLVDAFVIADNGMIGVNGMPPPGCEFLDDCEHPYVLIPDSECDDTCEDAIAARRNDAFSHAQIRPLANRNIHESTPAKTSERWRNEMQKRFHVPIGALKD